nr:hypothetical protein [Lentzea californiensis]
MRQRDDPHRHGRRRPGGRCSGHRAEGALSRGQLWASAPCIETSWRRMRSRTRSITSVTVSPSA